MREEFWRIDARTRNRALVALATVVALAILQQSFFGGEEFSTKIQVSWLGGDRSLAINSSSSSTSAPIVVVAPSPSPISSQDFSSSKIEQSREVFPPVIDNSSTISPQSDESSSPFPEEISLPPSPPLSPSIFAPIPSPISASPAVSSSNSSIAPPPGSPSSNSSIAPAVSSSTAPPPVPSSIAPAVSSSPAAPAPAPLQKHRQVPQWRVSLEQGLREAKLAIESAAPSTIALDSQLTASIFHDSYKFQRSYELMEKHFRIYMYKEGKPRLVHKGPLQGIYSSEGRFIHEMNHNSRFITDDPEQAHMFFLPYSVAHMVLDLYVPDSHSMLPLATFIKNYVNEIAAKHPFWNMTQGSDHFFVSCHDWGPATARDHLELRKHAVKVVCNADTSEEFVVSKDVSLPETYLHSDQLPTRFGGPGASKRSILAFFAGQMHGRVRPVLLQYWKDKDPAMKIYEVLPKAIARKMSYENHMKASKFCICAAGYEVNSPRIVEAIYYECVPVLIADNFVLPFSDVLNWNSFSITVAEKDIPNLKSMLLAVSPGRYRSMQAKLKRVRQHFMWHENAQRFDMFHMILHSVWMRRLQNIDAIVDLEEQQPNDP